MALVLRACVAAQRRCCLSELRTLEQSTACAKYGGSNMKRFAPAVQLKWYSTNADKKSDELPQVYDGILAKQIKHLKIFSLASSAAALGIQPILVQTALVSDNVIVLSGAVGLFTFTAIGMPLLINMVTKKYVTHIFHVPKEDKYIYRRYTLFLRRKEVKFTPDDVVIPTVTGFFTSCLIKGESLFFDERHFTDISHYSKIMGYDKPIDLKLGSINANVEHTSSKDSKQKETENV